MPWKALSEHPDCPAAAVVKSDTGELVACHDTLEGAQAQVRALYAAEPEAARSESRVAEFRDMELQGMNFRGVAAVFDTPWNDELTKAMGYVENVARGAFRKALSRGGNIPLLGAHRRHELLASTQGKTLQVAEEPNGLVVRADLPKNYLGEYYREMIGRDDIRGMSYGMETVPADSVFSKQAGRMYRTIANIQKLLDVTLTWEPAYPATVAELRAAGLVVTPLQEIVGGLEEQPDEAATEKPPDTIDAEAFAQRTAALRINVLEGGFKP